MGLPGVFDPAGRRRAPEIPVIRGQTVEDHFSIFPAEPAFKPVGVSTAGAVSGPVMKPHHVLSILNGAEFENSIQSYDSGTVNTDESRRVELLFQRVHGFAQEVSTIAIRHWSHRRPLPQGIPIPPVAGDKEEQPKSTKDRSRPIR